MYSWWVASRWRLIAQIIRFCLQGDGSLVLLLFLPLTLKPIYDMLVVIVLYHDLQFMKVCRWLCFPDLQLHSLYHDFLLARRFWKNFPAPLLGVCWVSNNKTLDILCTPNAHKVHWQPFEFDFTIIPVIWIYRTVADPKNWMRKKSIWEFLLVLNWLP